MKPNHHSLAFKMQSAPNKRYKDLKQKQKARIAAWMYAEVLHFYRENQRMPEENECDQLCQSIYQKIVGTAIWVPYGGVLAQFLKKKEDYLPRILLDLEKPVPEKHQEKTKTISQVKKNRARKKKLPVEPNLLEQDDRFFYIAGYTPGGAPYGVTWEEMGLEPYQSIDE